MIQNHFKNYTFNYFTLQCNRMLVHSCSRNSVTFIELEDPFITRFATRSIPRPPTLCYKIPVHTNTSTTHNKLQMFAVLCKFQSVNHYTNQPNAHSPMPRSTMLYLPFTDSKERDHKKSQVCQLKFCMQCSKDCLFGYTESVK